MKMQFKLIDQFGNAFVIGGETKVEELTINGYKLVVNGEFKPEEEEALHLPTQQEQLLQ
jgi:hypothetical protein